MTAGAVVLGALGLTHLGSSPAATGRRARTGHRAQPLLAARRTVSPGLSALPTPKALTPFSGSAVAGAGQWHPVGRAVKGRSAVYVTTLSLPDNASGVAGIAWMDTKLLSARLYSGSLSPGGLDWKYTAPVSPQAATTLVAAFNGGFLLKDSAGGYYSEGKLAAPLRQGAASLVIYANGTVALGAWGREVSMGPTVVAVRQNLTLLIDNGRPAANLSPTDTSVWGYSLHGIANQWRSGLGVTANGALVYVVGVMNVKDLADELLRAGAVRAMVLDMNPDWTVFASYRPASATGEAAPGNGTDLLSSMYWTPARFFSPAYARDFIAMSAR